MNCSKEVVAIYPPILEESEESKRNRFNEVSTELKVVLDKQM
jgi:hypothetical protein